MTVERRIIPPDRVSGGELPGNIEEAPRRRNGAPDRSDSIHRTSLTLAMNWDLWIDGLVGGDGGCRCVQQGSEDRNRCPRVDFDHRLELEFHGARVASGADLPFSGNSTHGHPENSGAFFAVDAQNAPRV